MKLKRLTAGIIALMMIMCAPCAFAAELPADLAGSDESLRTAVSALMDAEAITGDTDGNYHPDANLTRAQVCCILVKYINPAQAELTGTTTVSVPAANFNDMAGYGWAAPYINYAAANGITNGYPDGGFHPGANVTCAELATFVARAAGVTDSEIGGTWPDNYIAKAASLKLFTDLDDLAALSTDTMKSQPATKAQAAIMTYNATDAIKAAAEAKKADDEPQGTNKDKADTAPAVGEYTLVSNGTFSSDFRSFNKTELAKDAEILIYGAKKEYKSGMTLSTNKADFRETTAYKYKGVTTPALVKKDASGKISSIILPGNVGFNGKIYCVITDTSANVLNYDDENVTGIETITAGRDIMWLGVKGLDVSKLSETALKPGTIVELYAKNGEIKSYAYLGWTVGSDTQSAYGTVQGKLFKLLEAGSIVDKDASNNLVAVGSEGWMSIKPEAAYYTYDKSDKEYASASKLALKKGETVFLYDISDDDEDSADIVVIIKE